MVNNSGIIRPMLSFEDKDDFYFVQVIKRRKDNPSMESGQAILGNFYIDSHDDFDKKIPQIITLCDSGNARAYLRVNKRNYRKLAQHFLKRVVDIVFTENCKSLRNSFDSVAGEFHSDPDKKWIVDLDNDKDIAFDDFCSTLMQLQKEAKRQPMTMNIPTKNGLHLITRPFNLQVFKEKYPNIDVHRDNSTLLYCP